MKRFIVALLLAVAGMVGLFLTTCGGIVLSAVMQRSGGGASSDRQIAIMLLAGGVLILAATVWGIVLLIRNRRSPREAEMQAHLDMLARQRAAARDATDADGGPAA